MPKASSDAGHVRRSPKGEGGWDRRFDEPIDVDGQRLESLRDAATYITRLPKAKQNAPQWQTAVDLLLKVAERGWAIQLADIAMHQAIHHGKPAPAAPPRRKAVRKYRVIR